MTRLLILAAAAAVSLGGCAARAPAPPVLPGSAAAARADLDRAIDTLVGKAPLHRTLWGILLVDAATGERLYARNPELHFIPASNTKLVVGAVALAKFGPAHRYSTRLYATSAGADTAASILVVGSGDPSWSSRFHSDLTAPFDSMAAVVAAAGMRAARELVIDVSLFRDELVNPTWEVSDLPGIYAPPVDAFAAAEGTFRIVVSGGAVTGAPASMRLLGPIHQPVSLSVTTDTAGAPSRLRVDYTARRDSVYISGSIGAGVMDTATYAVTQPAWSAGHALAEALRRRGISIGGVRVIRDPSAAQTLRTGARELGAYRSAPLSEIVSVILQPSQNWTAEQVLKTLGAEFGSAGTWRGGIDVERRYLSDVAGIDTLAVNLRDASGMSPQNLLAPDATVALLAHARAQPWGAAYRAAMAQPGVSGTTLSSRLRSLDGRVFGKTGTISNVNSLSGYLVGADGREYIFSVLTNGSGLPSAMVRSVIDEVVLAMARHVDAR